jgi:transposase
MLKYSVGLDVSSKKIDCCFSVIDTMQKVTVKSTIVIANNRNGFKMLENWIVKQQKETSIPLVICMEATGVYYESCALYLFEKEYKVSVVLPNKAKKYLQAIGLKSKNDSIDAKGLAQMGAEQALKFWQPLGKYFYELRQYTRQYQNMQEQKTVFNNQLHSLKHGMYSNKTIVKQLENCIKLFDKQLDELEKRIHDHIKSNLEVQQKAINICKIKGIATLSLATILAETNGFELFESAKQVVSYAGFDVIENQSGNRVGRTKISKQGNSRIRRILFMPAFTVVSCKQKPFLDLYNRTFERHGIKMKSYVAVQKKLLIIIYSLYKNNQEYNPEKYNIQEKEQGFSSLLAFEKGIKNSPNQVEAIQDKHPVKDHSTLPLC